MDYISAEKHLEGTLKVLKECAKRTENYETKVLGEKFVVYPNVFSPKYFLDTEFFAREISIKEGESFLEIGSGTGVISIFAIIKGAGSVTAVDINPAAVENTKENVRIHDMENKITVLQGSVYDPLPKYKKFNTIFWNMPFSYSDKENITILENAVMDPKYKFTKDFIFNAKRHLKPGGKLLIGFSTTLGRLDILKKFIDEVEFKLKLVVEEESVETYPVMFNLFEAVPTRE